MERIFKKINDKDYKRNKQENILMNLYIIE